MIKNYAFELGRKKELCLAELKNLLGANNYHQSIGPLAFFQSKEIDPQNFLDRLGGTIKIIEILGECSEKDLTPTIEKLLQDEFSNASGKIPFSLSTYNFKGRQGINIKEILNFSKKTLKSLGLNSRFVNQGTKPLRASTIYKAKVIQKGLDLCLINDQKCLKIGKSVAMQNIDFYSFRDYNKPARDAHIGMTPPKLAQIMINLAEPSQKIYDPFCGTGTFLIEAMLMGKHALGSDLNPTMIQASKTNCQWICEKKNLQPNFKIFERDARFINKDLVGEIDSVVTEGYLGQPVSKLPSAEQREKTLRELGNLHLNWLSAAHKILKPKAKIVMCCAAFRLGSKLQTIPHLEELIKTAGFQLQNRYIYDREDQIVAREILLLEKKD